MERWIWRCDQDNPRRWLMRLRATELSLHTSDNNERPQPVDTGTAYFLLLWARWQRERTNSKAECPSTSMQTAPRLTIARALQSRESRLRAILASAPSDTCVLTDDLHEMKDGVVQQFGKESRIIRIGRRAVLSPITPSIADCRSHSVLVPETSMPIGAANEPS